jgi:hypothetical protein
MNRWTRNCWLVALFFLPAPLAACSLCSAIKQTPTMRQDATRDSARLVLFGSLSNPRLGGATPGGGITDLQVESVVKSDPKLAKDLQRNRGDKVEVPKYLPVNDPKNPPRYIIFCDVYKDKHDPYRGVPVNSEAAVGYLKGALALDPKDMEATLLYFARYLEHPDKEIANDALMEFVKANDRQVGHVAAKLDRTKVRAWLENKDTPDERLGLYGFLLGGCGKDEDAVYLKKLLDEAGERTRQGRDGLWCGYLALRPKEGWEMVQKTFADGKAPVSERLVLDRVMQFYHGWKPDEARPQILAAQGIMLRQGELADLAIENLRRWEMWDHTRDVITRYGQKGFDAPILQRAILRYAICCPQKEAKEFVEKVRKQDPELVKSVEESVQYERK